MLRHTSYCSSSKIRAAAENCFLLVKTLEGNRLRERLLIDPISYHSHSYSIQQLCSWCGKWKALHMKTKKKNGTIVDCTRIRAARKTPEPNNRTLHGYDEREVVSALEILNFEQPAWALNIRRSRPTTISSELRSLAYRSVVGLWLMKWSGNDTIQDGIGLEKKWYVERDWLAGRLDCSEFWG